MNLVERQHPIDLYGPKASKESTFAGEPGFKCDISDGLSSKVCRPCYEKITKFKKFSDIFLRSTIQQQSLIRFKRRKTQVLHKKSVSGSPGKPILYYRNRLAAPPEHPFSLQWQSLRSLSITCNAKFTACPSTSDSEDKEVTELAMFIGNCRNVRGLGKSMVVFRFLKKIRY